MGIRLVIVYKPDAIHPKKKSAIEQEPDQCFQLVSNKIKKGSHEL